MIGIFKKKSPVNIVLLLLLGLLIKMPLFLFAKPVVATEADGMLYRYLVSFFPKGAEAFISAVLAFILLYLQALLLNFLVNEYRLTLKPNYLPGMAYLLITSLQPEWNYFSAPLLANTFIVLSFIQLLRIYNAPAAKEIIYNTGLLLGICSFIFLPSVLIAICLLLGILILRPFRLNELFLLLIGVATPFYFYGVYLFLTDQFSIYKLFPSIRFHLPVIKNTTWLYVNLGVLVLPFLIGGYYIQVHLGKLIIQVRKNWSILLLYLLLSVLIPFVNSSSFFYNWILVTLPLAAFHAAAYLYLPRKWIALSLFFITVAIILSQQYATTLWH